MAKFNWKLITNYQTMQNYATDEERIGSGANGVVTKSFVKVKNEQVYFALKKLNLHDKYYEEQIKAYNNECNFLQSIDHPNIVKVYFYFENITKLEKTYYIGMEYGYTDLNKIIEFKKTQSTEYDIASIAQQLWSGLSYLEQLGVAHRDLKPENIILGQDGLFKICDFGEVKLSEFSLKSGIFSLVGTKPYLAPELLKNINSKQVHYNPIKTDTFSYGILLLQTILGFTQFQISGVNESEKTKNDLLSSKYRNLSESFKWFLQNCLNYNSNQRWSFKNMNEIFELNCIEACYRLAKKDDEINDLKNQVNQLKTSQKNIQSYQNQINELTNKNQQLQTQIDQLNKKFQGTNQQMLYQQFIQAKQIKEKSEQQLIIIFEKNQKEWKDLEFSEKKKKLKDNSGFESDSYSYYYYWDYYSWDYYWDYYSWDYYYYWDYYNFNYDTDYKYGFYYLSNKDGTKTCFKKDQMDSAVNMINDLAKGTNCSNEICIRILHSNLWHYEKSKNDLLY